MVEYVHQDRQRHTERLPLVIAKCLPKGMAAIVALEPQSLTPRLNQAVDERDYYRLPIAPLALEQF